MQHFYMLGDEPGLSPPAALGRAIAQRPPSEPPPPPPRRLDPSSRRAPGGAADQSNPSKLTPIPRSVFSLSARLPRTSSLLPPRPSTSASTSASRARSPSPVLAAAVAYAQHLQAHPPASLKRPSTPSSQAYEGVVTTACPRQASQVRNRWSISTVSSTSSRTPPFTDPQQSPNKLHRDRAPSVSITRSANSAAVHMAKPEANLSSWYYSGDHPRSASPTPQKLSAEMPHNENRDHFFPRGHSRDRSKIGSKDSGKGHVQKPPSQKTMLSRALQKANTAVQLDNDQNFEAARQAYSEACDLLRQVLQRTVADEDKQKLEAIRRTYTSRINELDQMGPWQDDTFKALPARPESNYSRDTSAHHSHEIQEEAPKNQPERIMSMIGGVDGNLDAPRSTMPTQRWQKNTDLAKDETLGRLHPSYSQEQGFLYSHLRAPLRLRSRDELQEQVGDASYAPSLLKSIRPPSLPRSFADEPTGSARLAFSDSVSTSFESQEAADCLLDGDQISWLDPIDESGGSTVSSVHSRTSSLGYGRRHVRAASGITQSEFDTALDAAIEAAYNDGYELMDPEEDDSIETTDVAVISALRKVEMARERVRQTEREAYYDMGLLRQIQPENLQRTPERQSSPNGFYIDDSGEEEERLLEEITRDFAIDSFTLNQQWDSGAAREPGVLKSEVESFSTLGMRSFSALSERPLLSDISTSGPLVAPPPTQALPKLPPHAFSLPTQHLRDRRFSGQNSKQLEIETKKIGPPDPSHSENLSNARSTNITDKGQEPSAEESTQSINIWQARSSPPVAEASTSELQGTGSPMGKGNPADRDDGYAASSYSPSINKLRKKFSSSSLRSMKSRNMSVSNPDEGSDISPGTPSGNHFERPPALPVLPTSLAAAFKDTMEASSGAGLQLFDDNFHMPITPGSPNPTLTDAPISLEACPTNFMLRPFWLMRCLYQTLVNRRGGYLSTKLFVPRDVWRVKGVKLKNVEDKIANCDYLTAALLKLAKVDTLDADAVLEEMQSLEGVLEQTQTALSRKLGNEVGVQGSGLLFKDASLAMDGDGGSSVPRSGSVSNKSSAFSWRRLRPKPSSVGLGGSYTSRTGSAETKDVMTLPTLPMTSRPTLRPAKRDVSQAQFIGPNANYMGSLARLFDAAQAIDQIARQVEDPGLRYADKTQVGLELCTRHAAEFFGFYICRFVLADLGMLLDKFIKRGSEWVLA